MDAEFIRSIPIKTWYVLARERLERDYGVRNLSLIEGFWLNKEVRETRDFCLHQLAELEKGNINSAQTIEIEIEAPARWLLKYYGMGKKDTHDLLKVGVVSNRVSLGLEIIFQGTRADEEYAIDLVWKLNKDKNVRLADFWYCVSEERKEAIQLMRENYHAFGLAGSY